MEVLATQPGLRTYEWAPRYSTSRDDLIEGFYQPAMDRALAYDRAVGFFRSSFLSIAGTATASLAVRGGKIRLLCSPDITADDALAIERGLLMRAAIDEAAQRELTRILEHPLARPAVELLAALVAESALDIRFAVRQDGSGIFHDKVGIFTDGEGDSISFSGSINETWQAWHPLGNHESFEVFTSWSAERQRVTDHVEFFDRAWHGKLSGLEVFEAPRAFRERLLTFSQPSGARVLVKAGAGTQRPRSLFDHQLVAIENWTAQGRRGILQHATGSGKTLTALHAVRDWIADGKPALIIVPSTLLLEQWRIEAERELALLEPNFLLVGGGHDEWREGALLRMYTEAEGPPRVTIATLQTASNTRFIESVRGGEHLLLVADEVHRFGSAKNRNVFQIESGPRLGLSATPVRARDSDGTATIFEYFGPIVPPIVTLRDAIAAGRLCTYEYNVHLIHLSDDETDQYQALTRKIGAAYGSAAGEPSAYLDHLLIQRARVVKQAQAKAPVAARIVGDGYCEGQHWLVYCDDQVQVRDVIQRLRARKLDAFEYHSNMSGSRDATMDRFRRFGGILVAIRCLDEGVDIPEVTHAVIVASSQNSREFIQRRGRVLRSAPGKHSAVIHDLLVEPPPAPDVDQRSPFASIAEAEIARAAEFALDAANASIRTYLDGLCIAWGIDPDAMQLEGDEAND